MTIGASCPRVCWGVGFVESMGDTLRSATATVVPGGCRRLRRRQAHQDVKAGRRAQGADGAVRLPEQAFVDGRRRRELELGADPRTVLRPQTCFTPSSTVDRDGSTRQVCALAAGHLATGLLANPTA
jgi:hypothetical protein